MQRALLIGSLLALLCGAAARNVEAQDRSYSALPPSSSGSDGSEQVDGIAARIEDEILTESEVRELGDFQKLVDGQTQPREQLIRELTDQWIVRGEAEAAKYPTPTTADVDRAYAQLAKQFPSPEEFKKRYEQTGLSEEAVRRLLEEQLYLSHFLDYRFRAAVQINDDDIQKYYDDEFAPQLRARGQHDIPPVDSVSETIREVLIQRDITDRSTKWLDDARQRLKIDVLPAGDAK
jgi:hypothetical protein